MKGFAQVKLKDLPEWLANHEPTPDLIVYEGFTLHKNKAIQQSGSNMPASQAIGMIKSYAAMSKIKLVEQPANILATAVMMTQMPLPSNHSQSHWVSAYNHGFFWLVKNGFRKVEMEDELQ